MLDCAKAYVKNHRKKIAKESTEKFHAEVTPISVFMAGSPGAGKTETSRRLLRHTESVVRIDADELRSHFKCCGYTGANSHLFQKYASDLVHEIHNTTLKNNLSFLLDGTFANENIARQNIERSLKRRRAVYIIFVYQPPQQAWNFVQEREEVEGRRILKKDFAEKFCASWEVVNKMKEEFGKKITLMLIYKDINGTARLFEKSIQRVDDYIPRKYNKDQILNEISD